MSSACGVINVIHLVNGDNEFFFKLYQKKRNEIKNIQDIYTPKFQFKVIQKSLEIRIIVTMETINCVTIEGTVIGIVLNIIFLLIVFFFAY